MLSSPPLAGCSAAPLSYLDATSPIGGPIASLGWGLTAISVGVCVIVGVLLLVAIWRRRPDGDLTITPVNDRTPIRWIGVGVGDLDGIAARLGGVDAGHRAFDRRARRRPAPSASTSSARNGGGRVKYRSSDPAREFITANQLVIPVGVPVQINLTSARRHPLVLGAQARRQDGHDPVAHQRHLARGRQGRRLSRPVQRVLRAAARQHGVQRARAVAGRFRRVVGPASCSRRAVRRTMPRLRTFMVRCAACHTIRGTPAGGILGPDLSHFGSRESIAAGLMPNTPENLANWINNTQTIKPGVKMPELHMLASEIDDVTRYLEGLK